MPETPLVTLASLRAAGYPVSTLKDEATIALALSDIQFAYFPEEETFEEETTLALLHALVYSLLLRRRLVATRFGTVTKNNQYSTQAEEEAITKEIGSYCWARMKAYYNAVDFEYTDILSIYDNLIYL